MFAAVWAVLNERNLEQSLQVLRAELQKTYDEMQSSVARFAQRDSIQHTSMVSAMQKSDQIALMLYSQKSDYVFDLTYACHEATSLYRTFQKSRAPYDQIISQIRKERERYTGLLVSLRELPPRKDIASQQAPQPPADMVPQDSLAADSAAAGAQPKVRKADIFVLSGQAQKDRDACIVYCQALLEQFEDMEEKITRDSEHYERISSHLKELSDYAEKQYHAIQQNVFKNGGDNYLTILTQLPLRIKIAQRDAVDKYSTKQEFRKVHSDWRGPVILGYVFFVFSYLILAVVLSALIVRIFLKFKRKKMDRDSDESIERENKALVKLRAQLEGASAEKQAEIEQKIAKKESKIADKEERLQERFEEQDKKRIAHFLTLGVFIFAVSVLVASRFLKHNFYMMASGLLIEFALLLVCIFASLLFRLKGSQMKSGFRLYTPLVLVGLVVIIFRIVFVPNTIVNLLFPPIILAFTLWQFFTLRALRKRDKVVQKEQKDQGILPNKIVPLVPHTDAAYGVITLIVMVVSCLCSWLGYTLLAVEVLIWWLFQITFIHGFTCIYHFLSQKEEKISKRIMERTGIKKEKEYKLNRKKGFFVTQTWGYDFVHMALVPIIAVFSVLWSIYLAAKVFDMTSTCMHFFITPFVDVEGVIRLSLFKIVLAAALFFLFRYLVYLAKGIYRHLRLAWVTRDKEDGYEVRDNEVNLTLGYNVIAIIGWGVYIITAFVLLRIPRSGISIVTAGLATGLGFAMKDILNNFFYGIQLMTGRLRVGDWIECDGVQGRVTGISYQSTEITTLDNCVMAFLNSTLFSKNFKNLTRNNSYELQKIAVGVAYGTDISKVRKIVKDAVWALQGTSTQNRDIIDRGHDILVRVDNFGDSSVDISVLVWVLVIEKTRFVARAKEAIYNAFNKNGIEIPFPQQDIYVKTLPAEEAKAAPVAADADEEIDDKITTKNS